MNRYIHCMVLCSVLVSACSVGQPGMKYDIENENRIRELSIKRDFVSSDERYMMDRELSYRKYGLSGYLFDSLSDSDVTTTSADSGKREEMLNRNLDKQLGRSTESAAELKDKILDYILQTHWGGQKNVNGLLLKAQPATLP